MQTLTTNTVMTRHSRYAGPRRLPPSMSVYGVSFRTLLVHLIRINRITHQELGNRVGRSQAGVTQIVQGQVRPPLDEMEVWADALRLVETEREKFIRLANLAHVPDYIAEMVVELETTIAQQAEQIQKLQGAVTRLEADRIRKSSDA